MDHDSSRRGQGRVSMGLRLSGGVMRGMCVGSPTMIRLAGGGEVLQVRGGGVEVLKGGRFLAGVAGLE